MWLRSIWVAGGVVGVAVLLSGCSGGGAQAPAAFASADECKSQKAELSKLASQGVVNDITAADAGRKLSGEAQARVDRYNALLNSYLGGGCHNP